MTGINRGTFFFYERSWYSLLFITHENAVNDGNYAENAFCIWKFALSKSDIMPFVPVAVSMKINRNYYFWSDLLTNQ